MYQKITTRTSIETKTKTTAHLAQSMTLLNMGGGELEEEIQKNLAANPALEIDEVRRCAVCGSEIAHGTRCNTCMQRQIRSESTVVSFISTRERTTSFIDGDQQDYFEEINVDRQTLPEYILKQIGWNLSDPEKMVAANILTQLDDDGFVKIDVLELASYYHVPISTVENVISQIQRADPIGSGCEDSQEAMLVQLDELQKIKPIPSSVQKIIADHYDALLRKHFKEIGRTLNISQTKVEMAAQFISENLNPFPARANWGDFRNPIEEENTRLGQPDIILSFFEDDPQKAILLEIFQPYNSNLVLNNTYKIAIKESDKITRDEMKADLNRASLFIKCIQQRANTILQLMEMLVNLQERFIREGDLYLKPITRAQIAKQMDVHESTISRAVSSKTVQMPDKKIYPLAIFFDRSLRIRTLIKEMISTEVKPLSDMEIMKRLEKMDISIARRTVAKYRDMEGIPSAHQRKEK